MRHYLNRFIDKSVTLIFCVLILSIAFMFVGCSGKDETTELAADTGTVSSAVSSEPLFTAEEAVVIYVGDTEVEDVFLMKSNWSGEEYKSDYTLNRIMMEKYLSKDSVIPEAANKSTLTLKFEGDINPVSVELIRHGNTFKSDTGVSYEPETVQLSMDENGDYQAEIRFISLRLYYYQLDCKWSNGDSAQYVFALKKS